MQKLKTPVNLVELFENGVKQFKDNPLFGLKNESGTALNWMTYGEVGRRVDNLRGGLVQKGIGKDNVVGFIGNNRPEWAITAFATYGAGAQFVPHVRSGAGRHLGIYHQRQRGESADGIQT
jgi:long-chain acyl-CoA synthetase